MSLPLAKAELVGTLLEAICYGMYFVISLELFRLLYLRLRAGRQIVFLVVTAVIIFALITTHLVLQINRIIKGFTDHMDVANAPTIYFNTLSLQSRMTKNTIYMTLTLVCDALFVYRAFVVCERKYVSIIFPSLLFLTDIALSAWSLWTITQIHPGPNAAKRIYNGIDPFYAMTLTLNLLCTVMISWNIWAIHRNVSKPIVAGVRFMDIMAAIVESAAVYSCVLIALLVTSVTGTVGLWTILSDSVCPIIGIIFSAVIVRSSREYHTDAFMAADLSLPRPASRPTDHAMGLAHQETAWRNAGEISTEQTVQVPCNVSKRSSLTFHVSASPRQASYADVVEKGHQTLETGS